MSNINIEEEVSDLLSKCINLKHLISVNTGRTTYDIPSMDIDYLEQDLKELFSLLSIIGFKKELTSNLNYFPEEYDEVYCYQDNNDVSTKFPGTSSINTIHIHRSNSLFRMIVQLDTWWVSDEDPKKLNLYKSSGSDTGDVYHSTKYHYLNTDKERVHLFDYINANYRQQILVGKRDNKLGQLLN